MPSSARGLEDRLPGAGTLAAHSQGHEASGHDIQPGGSGGRAAPRPPGFAGVAPNGPTLEVLSAKSLRRVNGKPKIDRAAFAERFRSGRLERLTTGRIARDLGLANQYRLFQQGDVARRLGLHEQLGRGSRTGVGGGAAHGHAGHLAAGVLHRPADFPIRGRISPRFTQRCFAYHCGYAPRWYPPLAWYPRWDPWVRWCWHCDCHPVWDPRPVWCRPVIYDPCPLWVWYECPVWVPLPVVVSGTWVDVSPVVVQPDAWDLQLLAVRFVDPGHPEEFLGPRYRVWFRNNSGQPITRPFDVVLVASIGPDLIPDLPQAGVRVTAMEAGDVQSVDVRLPFAATRMGMDTEGRSVPFDTLHVLVDAARELAEMDEMNNGARLAAADILPVDPAAFAAEPESVAAGGELVIAGEGFGPQPGRVLLHLGGIEMEPVILGWYDLGVRLTVPELPLAGPAEAQLIVVRGDGAAANPLPVVITPRGGAAEAPPPPGPE